MAEARAAAHEPQVRYHEEGTSEKEQETKVAKSFFQDLKLCAFRTRYVRTDYWFHLYRHQTFIFSITFITLIIFW